MSAKNQITLAVQAMQEAGIRRGDRVEISASGSGTLVIRRAPTDDLSRHEGALPGVYEPGDLDELRDEWR